MLCLVLRAFPNPGVEAKADPAAELEAFHLECVPADLEMVERKLDRAKKDKTDPLQTAAFELMKSMLEAERPIRSVPDTALHREMLTG